MVNQPLTHILGMNPLHVAAKFGNSANVIDFLIDSGVEINSKDRIEQVTPITMMVRRYYEHTKRDKPDQDELFHVVKKMLSAGGKLSLETFLLPLQQKDLELVKFLFATSGMCQLSPIATNNNPYCLKPALSGCAASSLTNLLFCMLSWGTLKGKEHLHRTDGRVFHFVV